LRYPQAIALIRAFIDYAAALVVFSTTAFRMPSRCFRTIAAALTIGGSLLRDANAAQNTQAFLAQPFLV